MSVVLTKNLEIVIFFVDIKKEEVGTRRKLFT